MQNKVLKMQKCFFISLLMSFVMLHAVHAQQGDHTGGGGSGIHLLNDQIVPADLYVNTDTKIEDAVEFKFSSDLVEELKRAVRAMIVYGYSPENYDQYDEYLNQYILGADLHYYLVDKIPEKCPYFAPNVEGLPEGGTLISIACTYRSQTYMIKEKFKKMNLRNQALLIIHESLRRQAEYAYDVFNSNIAVAVIIKGLALSLSINNEEQKGVFRQLSDAEVKSLSAMGKVISNKGDIFATGGYGGTIHSYGGGVTVDSAVYLSSYIGAGQALVHSYMGKNSKFFGNDLIVSPFFIGNRSVIKNTSQNRTKEALDFPDHIKKRAFYIESKMFSQDPTEYRIGDDVIIDGSVLHACFERVTVGSRVSIIRSGIGGGYGGSDPDSFTLIGRGRIAISDDSSIKDVPNLNLFSTHLLKKFVFFGSGVILYAVGTGVKSLIQAQTYHTVWKLNHIHLDGAKPICANGKWNFRHDGSLKLKEEGNEALARTCF